MTVFPESILDNADWSSAPCTKFPGTISNIGGWKCRPCFDRANGITRGAA